MMHLEGMSVAELCYAIKAEGAMLGVNVEILPPDGLLSWGPMILRRRHDGRVDVFLGFRFFPMVYGKQNLVAGLRRWMSLRIPIRLDQGGSYCHERRR